MPSYITPFFRNLNAYVQCFSIFSRQNGEQSSQMSNDKINPMSNKCEHDPIINSRETCEESSQMQSSTMDVGMYYFYISLQLSYLKC